MLALRGSLAAAEGVRSLYGVDTIPRTFLIDRKGSSATLTTRSAFVRGTSSPGSEG